jgi:uncharacterized protein YcbK (DUF882 family)
MAPKVGVWPIARPEQTLAAIAPDRADAEAGSEKSLDGGDIVWNADHSCVPDRLKKVLVDASRKFGTMIVWSTNRPPARNRSAGGARQSYHLDCRAIDFRPARGGNSQVIRFLRTRLDVGGWNIYRNGLIHIDDGPRRTW